jgi:hypothetical protein
MERKEETEMRVRTIRMLANPISKTALKRSRVKPKEYDYPHVDGLSADGRVRLLLGGGWIGYMTEEEYGRMRRDIGGKPYSRLAAQDLVKSRNKKLTPERRSEIASGAANAKWAKRKAAR